MGFVLLIAVASIFISCSKSGESNDEDITTLTNTWLAQQKSALSNCTCLTAIYQGEYLGQVVFEIRSIDPLCLGINIVYKADGSHLLTSSDHGAYDVYLASVKNLQKIWSCSKSE